MDLIFAHEEWDKFYGTQIPCIFLAGPSPRTSKDVNWRPDAIAMLRAFGFKGGVLIPLPRDGEWKSSEKISQWDWEDEWLKKATVIVFWVPRDKELAPALTTNIEFGKYLKSEKIVLGNPPYASSMSYMRHNAQKHNVPVSNSLGTTLKTALELIEKTHKCINFNRLVDPEL